MLPTSFGWILTTVFMGTRTAPLLLWREPQTQVALLPHREMPGGHLEALDNRGLADHNILWLG
jgi:hypothetical protein